MKDRECKVRLTCFSRRPRGRSVHRSILLGDSATLDAVLAMQAASSSTSEIARATGLSRQTVLRIKKDPAKAVAALKTRS